MSVLKIAVITPYFKEPINILKECHLSVVSQKSDASITHFLIADGFHLDEINSWEARHISLPRSHDDNGNTPRGIGSIQAIKEGYDFITFLDADNWFHQNHLQSMLDKWIESKSPVICSLRTYHQLNGKQILFEEPDENSLYHVDTSCFFLHKDSFDIIDIWLKMPNSLGPLCDRIFMSAIKWKNYSIGFSKKRTVAFRSQYLFHYLLSKTEVSLKLKSLDCLNHALDYLQSKDGKVACEKIMGFWPLSYMKSYNLLFLSEGHPYLSSIAHIFTLLLSFKRFNVYRAYFELDHQDCKQIEDFSREMGQEFTTIKNNSLVKDYLSNNSPRMDFVFIINSKTSNTNSIKWPGKPKVIYWTFAALENIQSNEYEDISFFNKIASSVRLKVESFLSLTEEELEGIPD
jgi:hypothetical protein